MPGGHRRLIANINLVRNPADTTYGNTDLPATIHVRPNATGLGRVVLKLPRDLEGDYYVVLRDLIHYPWRVAGTPAISAEPVHFERREGA